MSVASNVTLQIEFSGDVAFSQPFSALENVASPGENLIQGFTTGDNTISAPQVSGIVTTGVTIIPPSGNTIAMILKGNALDIGIPLHLTNPSYIPLDTTFVSLILTTTDDINGVRIIWS